MVATIVPALMALLGFGLSTMIVTVFLFSVWVIALDTQVGVERVNPSLVEMGRSFGASKRVLYSQDRRARGRLLLASEAVAYFERKVSFYASSR
jgi:hypothetical protein